MRKGGYQDELAAHAKFQDPRATLSGRKVNAGREERKCHKYWTLGSACGYNAPGQHMHFAQTNDCFALWKIKLM